VSSRLREQSRTTVAAVYSRSTARLAVFIILRRRELQPGRLFKIHKCSQDINWRLLMYTSNSTALRFKLVLSPVGCVAPTLSCWDLNVSNHVVLAEIQGNCSVAVQHMDARADRNILQEITHDKI
jgi:hypothetical protein